MKNYFDTCIIGGGIIGLSVAANLCKQGATVLVLEARNIGHSGGSSSGLTRSFRCDYVDPAYALLATESRKRWIQLERDLDQEFLIKCGCLNFVSDKLQQGRKSYADSSYETLRSLELPVTRLTRDQIRTKYPMLNIDEAVFDESGGVLLASKAVMAFKKLVQDKGGQILEGTKCLALEQADQSFVVKTESQDFTAKSIVVATGVWTDQALKVNDAPCLAPDLVKRSRPLACRYFIPRDTDEKSFRSDRFPVFAYLDFGLYGHPIIVGKTKGLKIGQFNPNGSTEALPNSLQELTEMLIPSLQSCEVRDVADTDQGFYEMTPDQNFLVGEIPGYKNLFVAAGFCGTGFKFAPVIGEHVADKVLGNSSQYNFDFCLPGRFSRK